jgi:hypothetical protein
MMSTAKRNWTVGFYDGFYWIGVAMTLACFALILAGNTELLWRFEHTRLPLSWACAGAAVLAFLAAEFCHSAFSLPHETEADKSSQLALEWEAVKVDATRSVPALDGLQDHAR